MTLSIPKEVQKVCHACDAGKRQASLEEITRPTRAG
jgi:hypothetical protein